jgi:hypothetical protein
MVLLNNSSLATYPIRLLNVAELAWDDASEVPIHKDVVKMPLSTVKESQAKNLWPLQLLQKFDLAPDDPERSMVRLRLRLKRRRYRSRGQYPIVVGGTGLYLRALLGDSWDDDVPSDQELRKTLAAEDSMALFERLRDLDPFRAAQIHPNDRFRVIRALEINILTVWRASTSASVICVAQIVVWH